ncbi:universal stress protein [Streptomyces humicola]|uniref:universal stress protein n=1 Tax=Streptomyces humicola TaxID=2953240 RepID=UPI003557E90B
MSGGSDANDGNLDSRESGQSQFERGTDGPKVIVAGVDDSDSSWRAVAYAAGLARRQGALLAMVYVQPLGAVTAPGVAVSMAETTSEIAEEIIGQVRESVKRLGDDFKLRWEFHTFPGDPFTGLAKAADDLRADAVVVGASERAGHRIVGSLAVRLVKAARWPVTVVP